VIAAAARIALATLALGGGRIAVAAACGGDGDGDGSSGGNSSSSGDGGGSDSGATYVTIPACYDSSDVVGYRRCSSYGSRWAIPEHLPALALELTTWTARIDLADVEAGGAVHHSFGDDYNYRVVGADPAAARWPTASLPGRAPPRPVLSRGRRRAPGRRSPHHVDGDQRRHHRDDLVGRHAGDGRRGARIDRGYGRCPGRRADGGARGVVVGPERGACETTDTTVVGHAVVEGRVRATCG
jgi:hypothetical protein